MAEPILCKICGMRRARRYCPGIQSEICALCCGREREVTITCPLDCEYLREAHDREPLAPLTTQQVPDRDIAVPDSFLLTHEELIYFCGVTLVECALHTDGATDRDVRDALGALVQGRRTLESGLLYEARPENWIAAAIVDRFNRSLTQLEQTRGEKEGRAPFRNVEVLAALVFFKRLAATYESDRPRSRRLLDALRRRMPAVRAPAPASRIILG